MSDVIKRADCMSNCQSVCVCVCRIMGAGEGGEGGSIAAHLGCVIA